MLVSVVIWKIVLLASTSILVYAQISSSRSASKDLSLSGAASASEKLRSKIIFDQARLDMADTYTSTSDRQWWQSSRQTRLLGAASNWDGQPNSSNRCEEVWWSHTKRGLVRSCEGSAHERPDAQSMDWYDWFFCWGCSEGWLSIRQDNSSEKEYSQINWLWHYSVIVVRLSKMHSALQCLHSCVSQA